jgi:hypothetical protein
VNNVKQYLENTHPDIKEILVLTDDTSDPKLMPTRANIISAMQWLVQGAKAGDSFFLHYSGHGGSTEDLSGDEEDGKDETILPSDFESAGQIIDDDLHRILLADLPEGCKFTSLFDSCHSGSVLDLDITYSVDGENNLHSVNHRKEAMDATISAVKNYLGGNNKGAMNDAKKV